MARTDGRKEEGASTQTAVSASQSVSVECVLCETVCVVSSQPVRCQEIIKQSRDNKAKFKAKVGHDQWEHDEKQAQVRQKVEKVQGFDDAVAARIEQESSMAGLQRAPSAGAYFKRLDTNKECAMRTLRRLRVLCRCTVFCELCCQLAQGCVN